MSSESLSSGHAGAVKKERFTVLLLGALGVVFGDIGTSPLYAFRECFAVAHGINATPDNILGVLSLIFWSMTIVVSLKYVFLLLRIDNRGEGGVLALSALLHANRDRIKGSLLTMVFVMGLLGAAFLYGDGIITPAISILSAVEGLNTATNVFAPYTVYISLAIVAVLYIFQRKGAAKIGVVFGPVLLVWFTVIGVAGLIHVAGCPEILKALDPRRAVCTLWAEKGAAVYIIGSVLLAITGCEALYADMGHFGKTPIRLNWLILVKPALILNYLGQGVWLMRNPEVSENLFYRLYPSWLLYPMVILATVATVIASQAVISGAFSLTRQAIQLNCWPRMRVIHTSDKIIGQVYVPAVNWFLFIGTSLLIIFFRESGNLAGAYGVAVAGTMLITTALAAISTRKVMGLSAAIVLPAALLFLSVDSVFFLSSLVKIAAGGWVPILVGAALFSMAWIWKREREFIRERITAFSVPVERFVKDIQNFKPVRVPGAAVFLSGNPHGTPRVLLHNFKHNKILHKTTVLMTVITEDIPHVPQESRCELVHLGEGLYRLVVKYGFCEDPNIPELFGDLKHPDIDFSIDNHMSFFLGRESLVMGKVRGAQYWHKTLFVVMSRHAVDATTFFSIPPNQVIEVGIQIELAR
jgi:KUP system potassium uptake protein